MISISNLINSFLIGILFADLVERRFRQEFINIITNISYNGIYLYSKIQIYLNKIKKHMVHLKLINSDCNNKSFMQFVKNGELFNANDASITDYNFILFSFSSDDGKCFNKKILNNKTEIGTNLEISNISFVLIELFLKYDIKGNSYKVWPFKINLKTDEYNYYIVGNKFKKEFFIYYLKHHLKFTEDINDKDELMLEILDNNVNSISVKFTDKGESILLNKDNYKIILNESNEEQFSIKY